MGFRGSRKGTAYAAQVVSQDACRQAMGHGLREVEVRLCGPGSGRESAVRAIQALGIEVTTSKTSPPFRTTAAACPKARRVLTSFLIHRVMARYRGPREKIARRFGVALFGPSKALELRNFPPGQHGVRNTRRKLSEYGTALAEKQKLKFPVRRA
jgi:hypothetical protein